MDIEEDARVKLECIRWQGNPVCPHCGSSRVNKHSATHSYHCGKCKKYFTVRTGTIMEGSKVPLHKWIRAIRILHEYPSIPAELLGTFLQLDTRTATLLTHKIRLKYNLYM